MNFDYRNNIDESLNLKNLSICKDLIIQNKVEIIGKGTQGEILKAKSPDCGSVVIKRKLIKEEHKKWKENEKWQKEHLYVEYKIMQLTNRIINKFICPNFIKAYDYNNDLGIIIMEYANGDSKFLFKNEYYDTNLYKSYICQVLLSLYVFTDYTMLFHCDVKPKNILYKKIDENIVFHYKVKNLDYYVPTYGYLFMLADFGNAKFELKNRLLDVENFNYKIIDNYFHTFDKYYPNKITKNELNNFINILCEKKTNKEFIEKINNLINFYKSEKSIKINKYIFELYDILNSSKDILIILNTHYKDFTINNYKKQKIIDFNLDI